MRIKGHLTYYLFIAAAVVVIGCQSTEMPNVAPSDLLIELSTMPANWYVVSQDNEPPELFGFESGADIWFNGTTNRDLLVAAHRIYRLRSENRAAKVFEQQLSAEFNSRSVASVTPWQIPPELPYVSSVADQFYFACHMTNINGLSQVCEAMGQYEEYLVIFHTHVAPDFMTYADIEVILKAIDERMANRANDN
jgi:hypothetical protein